MEIVFGGLFVICIIGIYIIYSVVKDFIVPIKKRLEKIEDCLDNIEK